MCMEKLFEYEVFKDFTKNDLVMVLNESEKMIVYALLIGRYYQVSPNDSGRL